MSRLIRLKHILEETAELVDGGVCKDDPYLIKLANRATMRVEDMDSMQEDSLCLPVNGGHVVLPRGYETIMSVAVKGTPRAIRNKHFEFLQSGAGVRGCSGCFCACEVLERAPTAVWRQPCEASSRIMIITDRPEKADVGDAIIYGIDTMGREVWHNNSAGETMDVVGSDKCNPKSPSFSRHEFTQITGLSLPLTSGYKYVYAYRPGSKERWLLGIYHPMEDSPMYRQYRVHGATEGTHVAVNAIRSLEQKVFHEEDVMPIQNVMYYYYAMQALEMEKDPERVQASSILWNKARKMIQTKAKRMKGTAVGPANFARRGFGNSLTRRR